MNEKESKKLVEEFSNLFSPLRRPLRSYRVHPSNRTLEHYLQRDLPDKWQRPSSETQPWMQGATPTSWTISEVSLHVASCERCSKTVAELRRSKKKYAWFEEKICAFGLAGQKARLWAYAYTAVALLILTLNVSLQTPLQEPIKFHTTYVDLPTLSAGDGLSEYRLLNGYRFATYFRARVVDQTLFFQPF